MKNFAVIVTYFPDVSVVSSLCRAIVEQNFFVVIVDNSDAGMEFCCGDKCHVILLEKNEGIATAQNIGINYAIERGGDIISFFDQDSVISNDLLLKLAAPHKAKKLLITAPVSININTGVEYPSRILDNIGLSRNVYSKNKTGLIPVDIVISSGVTVSVAVFSVVGVFDQELFIDFVDVEWCLRCREKEVDILIVSDAIMGHLIGERSIKVGSFKSVLHSPIRTYYKVRNSILLLRKNVNIIFSLRQISSALIHNLFLMFYAKRRILHIKFYLLGVLHGVLGKTGKYQRWY